METKVVVGTDEHLSDYQILMIKPDEIENQIDAGKGNIKYITLKTPIGSWTLQLFEYTLVSPECKRNTGSVSNRRELPGKISLRTFKGFANGNNQSKVSLSINTGFLKLTIDDGLERYFIEPLDEGSLNKSLPESQQYLMYRQSDVLPNPGAKCGVHDDHQNNRPKMNQLIPGIAPAKPCNPCAEVKIALAADYIMFRKYKADVIETENQMITILADVQTVFDDEFENEYMYAVTGIFIVEEQNKDPWNGINDLNGMLNQFANVAPQVFAGSQYNVATLWTAKFGPLGEVGIAFQASICTSNDVYNVCSDYWGPGGRQGDYLTLQAHMLGHNWSMIHDAGISPTIMAPGLPNGSTQWSGLAKTSLNDFVKMGMFLENKCLATCPNSSAPVPDFSSDITYGCQPVTIKFKDLSLNTTKWKWRFPGGMPDSSTLQNPVVVYKVAGIYPVTLEAGNHRCEVELIKTDFVEINDVPVANFSFGQQGREVFLIDQSLRADSYFWDFGDGETSEDANPYHVYYTDSSYTVKLTVQNDCGMHSITKVITLVSIPTADFDADTTGACSPGLIYFKDMSSPNSRNWQWEFPGGIPSFSTAKNPVVRYDFPGKYDVKLTVYSSRFNSNITKKEFITIDSIPIASFSQMINVGQVDFISNSRHAKSHFWDFGDGSSSTEANPGHLYMEGTYTVCYVAINNCGTDTLKTNLTIGVVPVAGFLSNKQSGCATYMVQFQNNSQSATNYQWTFPGGNPSTSTEEHPLVEYNAKGKYDVSLIASNVFYSDTITQKEFVEVRTKPVVDFSTSIQGFNVQFTDQTIDGTNYIWDFGDNKASFMKNPSHDYGVEGEFNVKLIVQNTCGVDTLIKKIAVYLIPKVGFGASVIKGCPPLKVDFKDLSSVDVVSWDWQFESGNPAISTDQNPSVVFDKKGKYAVKLTVRNTNGTNSLTRVQYIEVLSPIECPEHTKTNRFEFNDIIWEFPASKPLDSRISNASAKADYDFYPNPAGQFAFVKSPITEGNNTEIEIYSFAGRKVLSLHTNKIWTRVNLKELKNGSYLIRWKTEEGTYNKKMIISVN